MAGLYSSCLTSKRTYHICVDTPANLSKFCIISYSCIGINNYLNKKSNLKKNKEERGMERVCVRVWVCAVWPIDPHSRCPVLAACFWECPVATFSLAPPHRRQSAQAEGSFLELAQDSPSKPGPWNALLKQTPAHLQGLSGTLPSPSSWVSLAALPLGAPHGSDQVGEGNRHICFSPF